VSETVLIDNIAVPKDLLISDLRTLLAPESVMTDPAELFVYESDGFTIAKSRPAAVVFPKDTQQIVEIVRLLEKHNTHIVPRGSGTGLTGGCVAFDNGVVVSTVRLNRILNIDLQNRVAHVEAGVRNTQLSDAVARLPGGSAYHYSPDPSSQRASSIGGNASTNAGGIHVLKDFVTSNHILGMEMVMSGGEVIQIGAKDGCFESGIDLPGLVCGHEGTFGIITRLWVRLTPKATSFRTIAGIFRTTADACNTVSRVIAAGHMPAALEMLDGQVLQLVNDTFNLGFPKTAEALILCEIEGIDALLDAQMNQILQIMRDCDAASVDSTRDPETRGRLWKARKQAFGAMGKISPSYCTQDACVPRSMLAQVLARVSEIGREHGLTINNVFHAGDGNVHPIFLYDDRDERQVHNTMEAAEKVLKYCIDIGGTLTGEHGVGVEKIGLMPYMFDAPTMALFQRIKLAFDPDERINAGKLLPSEKLKVDILQPGRHVPQ
jgi:glycolate oxidase